MAINQFPQPQSGGTSKRIEVINSSQTWSHPDGASPTSVKFIDIVAVGGGSGGSPGVGAQGGPGGQSGEVVLVKDYPVTQDIVISVGAGGNVNSSGGSTSVGNIEAPGGSPTGGGSSGAPLTPFNSNGDPGYSVGKGPLGSLGTTGLKIANDFYSLFPGGGGSGGSGPGNFNSESGGPGGAAYFPFIGAGGAGGNRSGSSNGQPGSAGSTMGGGGGGGGGGNPSNGRAAGAGGVGAAGGVIIYY